MAGKNNLYFWEGLIILVAVLFSAWLYFYRYSPTSEYHMSGRIISTSYNLITVTGTAVYPDGSSPKERTVSFKITKDTKIEKQKIFIEKKYMLSPGKTGVSAPFSSQVSDEAGSLGELKPNVQIIDVFTKNNLFKKNIVSASKIYYRIFEYEK